MKETELFAKVVDEPDAAKRVALLETLCGADEQLKSRMKRLVAAYEQPELFFADPVQAVDGRQADMTVDLATRGTFGSIEAGTQIGPYKLLQQVGEGGMGLVFMAEQTSPVKRRVALKVIKPGMDSRQIIARFEAERQALAMMDHPNIAKVFDAGTTAAGHPYFVMELVNGMPINDYCDQEQMQTSDRLNLFIDVCHAVQHAHQKGIIHRDLKPNNILVAEYDGKPVPKVIDFGVAKATGGELTEKTLFTEFGQVIGTLAYMSPEQARRNQLDIDTRSDIYSLGIVLYKLLTGETPFDDERFEKAAWDEMLKIIREEMPPSPSLKISSSHARDQVAKNRGVEPGKLSSLVRGDLDWIVLKALQKDRNARYPSAGEMAADIDRHLHQQPVLAGPQGPWDRAYKFVRRNYKQIWASVVVLALLVYLGNRLENQLDARNQRVVESTLAGQSALRIALESPIGTEAHWETAQAHCLRIQEALSDGAVSRKLKQPAIEFLEEFEFKRNEREIAVQLEEVVIQGATNPDLASWQKMEQQMRQFFLEHRFDLDQTEPAEIGRRIRDDPSSVLWAELLELWIATRGHISALGGEGATAANMQPWAEAIYLADGDPIRTGIRQFVYQFNREKETLDRLTEGIELESLSPRTLSWLGTCYGMVKLFDESDRIYEFAIARHPRDLMLTHDYGHSLFHQQRYQESARMFHRCIAIRDDVAGIWVSLSMSLEALGETEAAQRARDTAQKLAARSDDLVE